MGQTRFFVRDDDVGPLTPALAFFVTTFLTRGVPVSYQIIPAKFTADCAAFLIAAWRDNPRLVEFGQHGLHHEMRLGTRTLTREFGPELSYGEQLSTIAEGRDIMRQRLGGEAPIVAFTPPRHKFNRDTVVAAAAAGYRVFSAACYPTARHQMAYELGRRLGLGSVGHQGISYHGAARPEADLIEMSISIAVDNGRRRQRSSAEIIAALEHAARATDHVGLMFHHEVYADPEGASELGSIADRIAACAEGRSELLSDVAATLRSSPRRRRGFQLHMSLSR
jgi:hypothetical protein